MARGCSTKQKIFHIECENHVMGRYSEKFCYCSYTLCNAAVRHSSPGGQRQAALIALLAGLMLLVRERHQAAPLIASAALIAYCSTSFRVFLAV